ncbi:FAD-dependent oxidoreductase [Moritella yayanosii]|uniref:FAD dependent oxidoreductase domain-containing protein n=1 Tax=Moritella yayanosii TaxID=69539 RepID=A0A330LQR0_9GAMM|nr:FAD-dependent oxidoreductase [Moritella yayanosii]SQD79083.1 conserved protein of unknown function might be FAD dependent oxidoreductase [Moritella yayanosii]
MVDEIFTATNSAQTGGLEATLAALYKHQLNSWQVWEAKKVQQHAGSELHQAGHFSPVAASVQPGKLARGLKRVAEQLGVRIYENTPMLAINDNAVKPTNSNKDAQHKVVINTRKGLFMRRKR